MYKKLSNDEWREYINRYYASDENLTVKDYCEENNINKSQFYYYKRKIEEKATPVFHPININAEANVVRKDIGVPSEVKILIGNISTEVSESETDLVNSLIKELLPNGLKKKHRWISNDSKKSTATQSFKSSLLDKQFYYFNCLPKREHIIDRPTGIF